MTLSFNKLNEIAELYESIAASEQEQLDEGAADAGVETRKAIGGALRTASDIGGSALRGLSGKNTTSSNPIARAANTQGQIQSSIVRGAGTFAKALVTGQGDKAATPAEKPGKYKSTSDGKMYATYTDAKKAHSDRQRSLAAKQEYLRSKGSADKGSADKGSGGNTRPPVNPKVAPTKPTGSAMDQWAKANPKLAAAKAERDRTRGTSATTNPLMKDTKANLPAPAAKVAPASSTLKSATDAASKPSAFTPKTTAVASSTTDKGVVPASNAIAAAPKPKPMVPTRMPLAQSFEYDAYDLVLEYLLSQGHAETVAEAQYLMTEMDAEMIGDIVEVRMDPRGRPASGPMNVYANPKKPSKEHSDAVKAYDEKQKKKTPEQRKKELDDYRERQMNNK